MKYKYNSIVESPVGYWIVSSNDTKIDAVSFLGQEVGLQNRMESNTTRKAVTQLQEYFRGERSAFDLALGTSTYSDFYREVWDKLLAIPYGSATSYQKIANALENPKAVRAVGMANGKNPIAIIIPCHRVIGSDNSLTGYAYGIGVKKWLLELEGYLPKVPTLF